MKNQTRKYLDELVLRYPSLIGAKKAIIEGTETLITAYQHENKLLVCGNGGSMADSDHIVGELMKGFLIDRKISNTLSTMLNDAYLTANLQQGLPAISLGAHQAFQSAFANDKAPDLAFAQGVLGYGKKGDVLLCISTSGNSKNCVYAAKVAKALDIKVIGLTGSKESNLSAIADITIKAPETETFKIQELHLPIYHAICLALENEFFGE